MKTYPTRHPNWIDETDGTQPPQKAWTERIGISFPVAYVIVLAFHLTILGGIYASNKIKLRQSPQPLAAKAEESPKGPVSDAFVASNDWPQSSATPELKAIPQLPKKALPSAKVAAKENDKPKSLFAPPTEKKIEAPKPPQAIAHVPSPAAAPRAIATDSTPVAPKAIAAIPAPAAPTKPTVQTSTPAPTVTE